MLRNSVNIKSGIEGSEIDPYNVDFVTLKKDDKTEYTLRRGSLTGDKLYLNDDIISESPVGDNATLDMFENLTKTNYEKIEKYKFKSQIARYCQRHGCGFMAAVKAFCNFNDVTIYA